MKPFAIVWSLSFLTTAISERTYRVSYWSCCPRSNPPAPRADTMPPTSFRKRARSPTPEVPASVNKKAKAVNSTTTTASTGKGKSKGKAKTTLFEAADTPIGKTRTKEEKGALLERFSQGQNNGDEEGQDGDSDSDLSEPGSDEFEDVEAQQPVCRRRKFVNDEQSGEDGDEDSDEEEGDDMQWEDAMAPATTATPREPQEIGDINITVNDDGSAYTAPLVSAATGKKGPSKKERTTRVLTHQLHVQSLMWHNTIRNSWLNDGEVQKLLVEGLSEGVKNEVRRWRESMGSLSAQELDRKKEESVKKKGGKKGKGKSRDWGAEAKFQEAGVPDLSHGDPLLRLLRILTAYWRKRFTITAPGIRKVGYMPLKRLRDMIRGWKGDPRDQEEYGERIESKEQFRRAARKCEGSRDVGEQLFVALLRGLRVETRLVANLQPVGVGWSKGEEADVKNNKKEKKAEVANLESEDNVEVKGATLKEPAATKPNDKLKEEHPSRKSGRGKKEQPINLEESDSELSELSDSNSGGVKDSATPADEYDDESVVDVTPATKSKKPNKKYDRDLAFPNYWAEVLSPVSNTYIPVDPITISTIGSNAELLLAFEPRGKKADKTKQVICYTIAHSRDGTAKDVTVRYLKKHQLPGKTKGFRVGPEKVPIYNRKGKVRKYEEYDWFKTVMSGYIRPGPERTAADDLEEQTDLKPFKPATEKKEAEKESLQWYKQSADYVLEQHLRREEAILPSAKPVRTFTAGKGDKAKDHPVYNRSDVVVCKTVESWHKEGRELKPAQQPMKYVPMRAVTLVRKREMEDAKRETGEALKQGLYSREQTDWIIPPPIVDGVIPKNAFGNMDVYVPTMVPEGAVHLPLKGSAKLCRKLDIDYAEACTGFEFGKQRAVPVLTGVVVAEEYEDLVRDAWRTEQKEIRRKEDEKRRGVSLHWWRKMVMGLRIVERMREEYDGIGGGGESNPFVKKAEREGRKVEVGGSGAFRDESGGGFFVPGHDEEEVPQTRKRPREEEQDAAGGGVGGFLPDAKDQDTNMGGGFLVEDNAVDVGAEATANTCKGKISITPISLQSMHKAAAAQERGEEDADEEVKAADEDDNAEPEPAPKPKSRRAAASAAKTNAKAKPAPPVRKIPAKRGGRKSAKAPTPTTSASEEAEDPTEDEDNDDGDDPDENEDDLSSLSSAPATEEATTAPKHKEKSTAKPTVSAKVVVPPAQRRTTRASTRGGSRGKTTPATGGRGGAKGKGEAGVKKATPSKSRYFASGAGEEGVEDGVEDEGDSGEESEEVFRTRGTTARTRGGK